ncbi:MAG: VOC family protein [Actinomycetota bacterium]
MGSVRGLDHVTIHTSRPHETIEFYVGLLGLEERPEDRPDFDFPGAWLWAGERPIVHLVYLDDDPGRVSGPFDHIAFAAADFDELQASFDAHDVRYRASARPDLGLKQMFLRDPNGVRVEITG